MRLTTLNVRGLSGEGSLTALVNALLAHNAHVCVLTETKSRQDINSTVTDKRGNKWRIVLRDSQGQAGVGLAVREPYMTMSRWEGNWQLEDLKILSERLLTFHLNLRNESFHIIGIYGPSDATVDTHETFLHRIAELIDDDQKTILLGDFNSHIRHWNPTRHQALNPTRKTTPAGHRLLNLMEAKRLYDPSLLFRRQRFPNTSLHLGEEKEPYAQRRVYNRLHLVQPLGYSTKRAAFAGLEYSIRDGPPPCVTAVTSTI